MKTGIESHTRAFRGQTDCWLTPPEVIKALGPFDLDPWPLRASRGPRRSINTPRRKTVCNCRGSAACGLIRLTVNRRGCGWNA